MKVIASDHKNNKILIIIAICFLFLTAVSFCISLFLSQLSRRIIASIIMAVSLVGLAFLILKLTFQLRIKKDIILYDENNNNLIVNGIKKQSCINLYKIKDVKYKNTGFAIEPYICITEVGHGKIILILRNGTVIKTPNINDVLMVHKRINELLRNL